MLQLVVLYFGVLSYGVKEDQRVTKYILNDFSLEGKGGTSIIFIKLKAVVDYTKMINISHSLSYNFSFCFPIVTFIEKLLSS